MSSRESVEHHGELGGVSPFSSSIKQDECTDQNERMDQDERRKDIAGKPKPIPIREVVGEPGPRPAGSSDTPADVPPAHAPGPRGQRERPEGPRGKGSSRRSEGGRGRRPDRKRAASGPEEPRRRSLERTPLEDLPFRSFEHDGCEWIVRLCGQSSTGSAMDPGAPLMHLVFYSGADPLVPCGDVLETGRSLDGLPELRLPELLTQARSAPLSNDSGR